MKGSQLFCCGMFKPYPFSHSMRANTRTQSNLKHWIQYEEEFADELIRHKGLGAHPSHCCKMCGIDDAPYRCLDCLSYRLFCADCIIHRHAEHPLHRIEVSDCFIMPPFD